LAQQLAAGIPAVSGGSDSVNLRLSHFAHSIKRIYHRLAFVRLACSLESVLAWGLNPVQDANNLDAE